MKIRPFIKNDAQNVSHCIEETTLSSNQPYPPCKFYSQETLNIHLQNYSPEKILAKSLSAKIFIAEIDGNIVGTVFILPRDKIIRGLFVLPEFQKKNVGRSLMNYAENWCIKHNISKVTIPASLNAASFYPPLGYINPQEKTVIANGTKIREIQMEKNLNKK